VLQSIELRDVPVVKAAALTIRTSLDRIGADLEAAYLQVSEAAAKEGATQAGPLLSGYPDESFDADDFSAVLGVPLDREIAGNDRVCMVDFPGGRAAVGLFVGPYDGLSKAWTELYTWVEEQGLRAGAMPYEVYRVDAEQAPTSAKVETDLVFPVVDR
jgi:effector-binding domain-containing protein